MSDVLKSELQRQRIQELEAELEEMTAALAQAWDQLVPFLKAAPTQAETTRDIAPLLESIMAAVDAPMGAVYLMPHANRSAEWFVLPADVVPLSALQPYLDELIGQGKTVRASNILAWNTIMTKWMLTPLMVDNEVVGAIGVGLEDKAREFNSVDSRLVLRMTERAANQMMAADLAHSKAREAKLEHELQIAGLIQRSIQPPSEPQMESVEVAADWQPAASVGGDAWGWVQQPSGRLACFMVDVAGKGLPAALAAVSLHTALKMVLRLDISPMHVLRIINREFYDVYTNAGILATATVITIDPDSGAVEHANAGHTPTLVWQGGQWQRWAATMPPLGVFNDAVPTPQRAQFAGGDMLLLYSDGLSEIETENGLWTVEGLRQAVQKETDAIRSAHRTLAAVLNAAQEARMGKPLHDDQTLVCLLYHDKSKS